MAVYLSNTSHASAKCFTYIIANTYKSPMKKITSISQIRTLKSQLVLQLQ